ncbi:unnamed protein product [Amoebophrya sp. A120]|nr:unnamed protein product [Amoebophrya sp. A120]|eukprot:GSA120T00000808001.1
MVSSSGLLGRCLAGLCERRCPFFCVSASGRRALWLRCDSYGTWVPSPFSLGAVPILSMAAQLLAGRANYTAGPLSPCRTVRQRRHLQGDTS